MLIERGLICFDFNFQHCNLQAREIHCEEMCSQSQKLCTSSPAFISGISIATGCPCKKKVAIKV